MPTYKRNMQFRRRNTSRNGGEETSAELDGQYKRLRRLGAKLAHKAQWHNERNAPIYASAECCPTRSGRRGFPQIYAEGERWSGKHVRKGEVLFFCVLHPAQNNSLLIINYYSNSYS